MADEYRAQYRKVRDMLNTLCYDKDAGMYTDGSVTKTYSMHTSVWAILSAIAEGDKAKELVDKMSTPGISECTFAMNYYRLRALEKSGRYDLAFKVFEDWRNMVENGCTTWCESISFPRSECHGWSSAPLYDFPRHILGVKIGYDDEIVIEPVAGHLSFARGVVPGRFGNISVSWTRDKDNFCISIEGADGIAKRVILPDGTEHSFDGGRAELSCMI